MGSSGSNSLGSATSASPANWTASEWQRGTRLGSFNSQLVAIDAVGGATVVNDLVFTSVLSGLILAFDRKAGEKVWSYQAPGGINDWPAFVEDMLIIPVGFGDPHVLLTLKLAGGP